MTIYTAKEYADKEGISVRTLYRQVLSGNLPSFVHLKRLDGRGYVLYIDQCELCNATEKAMREYSQRAGGVKNAEIATEMAIKYDLKVSKMFRLIGL